MIEVKVFTLVSGQEIVTRVVKTAHHGSEDQTITIEKPRVLMIAQVPGTAQVTVQLMPFCIGNPEGTLELAKDKILATLTDIPAELEKAYMQNTSSIALVS